MNLPISLEFRSQYLHMGPQYLPRYQILCGQTELTVRFSKPGPLVVSMCHLPTPAQYHVSVRRLEVVLGLSEGLPSAQHSPDLAEGQEAGERCGGQAARGGRKNTGSGVGKLGL